jgi:hypothetical protein
VEHLLIINNDTRDGQIILYQNNNNITKTDAFAYDNTDDKNRIENNDLIIKVINFILSNSYTNSEILAQNGIFNLNTTGNTNIKGGNIKANEVNLEIAGNLNLETMQDTYEQQGSSFGLNVGAGSGSPAYLNNTSISMGATEIFKKTIGRKTGIIELSSNDNNLSEEQNLTNLLASNSVDVTGNTSNQTVKKDIDFTNADFEGTLSIPVDLLTNPGKVKDAFENLDNNLLTVSSHLKGSSIIN